MRIFLVCILVTLFSFSGQGQKRDVVYNASLSGFASTQKTLPFWAVSNRHGLMPNGNGTLLELGFYSDFTNKHKIQFAYGVSAGGYLSSPGNKIILDQLFVSARWRKLRLDLGMIQPEEEYNGVSSTNGDFVRSGNSRTFPGYNLRSDFIDIPGTKGIIAFQFNWADYMMTDNSYVKDIRLHNKSLYVKITPHRRWEIIAGLEHWAQWAGKHPTLGKQPGSFSDYGRIIFADGGGAGATTSDSIKALGNHLGREHLKINYLADNYII